MIKNKWHWVRRCGDCDRTWLDCADSKNYTKCPHSGYYRYYIEIKWLKGAP